MAAVGAKRSLAEALTSVKCNKRPHPAIDRLAHELIRTSEFARTARLSGMSVLPSKADIVRSPRHVRFVPKPALTASKCDFRYTPESRLNSDIATCPKRAKSGLSNDVGLFAVEGHGRLRAPRSNTRTRWPHRTTRTLSFMATRTTGRGRLPEREWRAFRSIDGTEAVTHSSRGAVGHQPASRGTGFPFKISRRLTALENSTPCGQSRTSSRRAHGVEEACDVRLQPLGLLRQPTG